jgi:hypothetical protein
MDFFDVVDYVCEFDPQFAGSVDPATDEQIAELEALRGAPVPESYRGFLSTMGASMGWIDIRKLDFRIDTVLEYYRTETWLPADEFIRIGTDPKDTAFDPYLALSPLSGDPEVMQIRACTAETFADTRFGGGRLQLAGSLAQMVCLPVFEMFEIYGPGRRPERLVSPSWRPEAMQDAARRVAGLGFEPLFWSSEAGRGYRREDAAIQLVQLRGFPLQALVRADKADEQTRLAEVLGEELEIA